MSNNPALSEPTGYEAWLSYHRAASGSRLKEYAAYTSILVEARDDILQNAAAELARGMEGIAGIAPQIAEKDENQPSIVLGVFGRGSAVDHAFADAGDLRLGTEGYAIRSLSGGKRIFIGAEASAGVLYGVFHLLRLMGTGAAIGGLDIRERPVGGLRMINQWDNIDGSIERGYAGSSIFYADGKITSDLQRIRDYARLLASTGVNALSINNVNVHRLETMLITEAYLPEVARLAGILRGYGIKLFLSINYAAPLEIGGLPTADPLDPEVRRWWCERAADIYRHIPDLGGFLVKADSENRPGPFTYGRDHADGANMLAEALKPHGGIVIWRCFVYNCKQDWRDRKTDRARAAYDHFVPLDGRFHDNVILQVKNGPIDFQVREPVSPLLGAMPATNQVIEFQITQEYTGQQRHVCYLVPQWKEVLEFDTYVQGDGTPVGRIVDGSVHGNRYNGFAAVSNIGDDANWTGHLLAQANLYGYGRLVWNPKLTAEEIAEEWIRLTFGDDERAVRTIRGILLDSLSIYESYTAPLGIGFMVNPNHHYGPNVDGYEYSMWGTYHFADCHGIGVDRTKASGTGYTAQYAEPNFRLYESLESCPDELLLFFHHVPYTHVLHSGKTVIQHIYDTHFEGVERAARLEETWGSLAGLIPGSLHKQVAVRLTEQAEQAKEWRDQINTYFYRKSAIPDEQGRRIY